MFIFVDLDLEDTYVAVLCLDVVVDFIVAAVDKHIGNTTDDLKVFLLINVLICMLLMLLRLFVVLILTFITIDLFDKIISN